MPAPFEGKFDGCTECRFFRRSGPSATCNICDVGEFFDPRINDMNPNDDELMKIYAGMSNDKD